MLTLTYTTILFIALCLFISQPEPTPIQPQVEPEPTPIQPQVEPEPTPSQPEPTSEPPLELTLEQLKEVAKVNKVKGWNLYRNPVSLAAKLTKLGII